MKSILLPFAILVFPASMFAQSILPSSNGTGEIASRLKEILSPGSGAGPYLQAESSAVEKELLTTKPGDLTLSEILPYRDRLSIAAQEDAYVKKMAERSFKVPGSGQIKMGDAVGGAAFASLHIALLLGQTLGAFLLLPQDLRQIDYLHEPIRDIFDAYESHNAQDFFPSVELSVACVLADLALMAWSSGSAEREAKERVDQGRQTFEPRVGPGFLGFGIAY
jgi:hypothetical protein